MRLTTDVSSPPPPPHVAADWGGYTPVPSNATLPDGRMCTGYVSETPTSRTLDICRSSCDASPTCMGFSWGLNAPPPPPSPSPPPALIERRRALLAHDEPAVAGKVGSCFLMTSTPTNSSVVSNYIHAGCYAKGTRLPAHVVHRVRRLHARRLLRERHAPCPVVSYAWSGGYSVHWRRKMRRGGGVNPRSVACEGVLRGACRVLVE